MNLDDISYVSVHTVDSITTLVEYLWFDPQVGRFESFLCEICIFSLSYINVCTDVSCVLSNHYYCYEYKYDVKISNERSSFCEFVVEFQKEILQSMAVISVNSVILITHPDLPESELRLVARCFQTFCLVIR